MRYYNRYKYLLESDQRDVKGSSTTKNRQVTNNIITGASVGIGGVIACLTYLRITYGITDWKGLSKWFNDTIAISENDGWFSTFIKRIIGSIGSAITWANNLVKPLTANVPFLNSPIAGSQFTYGSCMAMTIIAAAVGAVIYKVYNVIKNRMKSHETTELFFVRQKYNILTALNECDSMFNELNILNEQHLILNENLWSWFSDGFLSKHFISYKNVSGEAINKAYMNDTTQFSKEISKSLTTGDSFISKIWANIQKLYNQVADIAKNMPTLAKVVIVITALVGCWFGIKKYLKNKKAQYDNNQNNIATRNTADT